MSLGGHSFLPRPHPEPSMVGGGLGRSSLVEQGSSQAWQLSSADEILRQETVMNGNSPSPALLYFFPLTTELIRVKL